MVAGINCKLLKMNAQLKKQWRNLDTLYKLLIVNVAVFILLSVIKLFAFLLGTYYVLDIIVRFFSMPAAPLKLLLKLWTPFTYMFLHESFWHIFANMLWLYFMGLIFEMYFSGKKLWHVYVLGGLAGAALYFLAYNIFPAFWPVKANSYLMGASAAVSAIVLAVAVYKPQDTVYVFGIFRVPLWLIGALYVLYDLSMIPFDNPGGHIAHLGGAAAGFYFAWKYRQGRDITAWMENIRLPGFRKKPKMRVVKNDYRPKDYAWNKQQKDIREEIDRILDKISKYGYNSLTKKEREFLREHSRDYDGFYG